MKFDSLFDLTRDRWLAVNGFGRAFAAPGDLLVSDDEVTVVVDVPGLTAENLEIELVGDVLTIKGERPQPHFGGQENRTWYRFERGYGKFQRILQVPKGLGRNKVTASITDGVLTVHIPQPEARKPRRIEIATGGAPPRLATGKPHPDFEGEAIQTGAATEEREAGRGNRLARQISPGPTAEPLARSRAALATSGCEKGAVRMRQSGRHPPQLS